MTDETAVETEDEAPEVVEPVAAPQPAPKPTPGAEGAKCVLDRRRQLEEADRRRGW